MLPSILHKYLKSLTFLVFFLFLASVFSSPADARPAKPTFKIRLPNGSEVQGSDTYQIKKGDKIKVVVSDLDLNDDDFDYQIVIGRNETKKDDGVCVPPLPCIGGGEEQIDNDIWGHYRFIRLKDGQCIGTSEDYTPGLFEGAICSGNTFTTTVNTSALNQPTNTDYYIRLEDSDGDDERNPIKFRLFTTDLYFTDNFTPVATAPVVPLGTDLTASAYGLVQSDEPYFLRIQPSQGGPPTFIASINVAGQRCTVVNNTPEPQPFAGSNCFALNSALSVWEDRFTVRTDSDSLDFDLTRLQTTYLLKLSGPGLGAGISKTFTVTNIDTKYAVNVDNVTGLISCRTSSDTTKELFNTREECEETLDNWKWFLTEESIDIDVPNPISFGNISQSIQTLSCKALDITDPNNSNTVNNFTAYDTLQSCKNELNSTKYAYQLGDQVIRACHQDITGGLTPSFSTFELCKVDMCNKLEQLSRDEDSGARDDYELYCSALITITVPPPKPPCAGDIDGTGCSSVNTALGEISVEPAGFIRSILGIVLSISGAIALLLIIYSGYKYMASNGNPEAIQAARETLTSAIVGLLFIIFSLVILQVIGVDILRLPGFGN